MVYCPNMGQFYNAKRSASWNYGGKNWKLSRSKIDLFLECPKCFYIDNKLGTKRPPSYPLTLNVAVDALLKKEFDIHRAKSSEHPLLKQYKVDAVPFVHKDINVWRENFRGIEYLHKKTGMLITGAIDDVWIDNKTKELIVVDYKATSKEGKITALDPENSLHQQYKRQMEVYQWLLRRNGFSVSNKGYLVYANGSKDEEAFDGKLIFEVTLVPCVGDDGWVESAIEKVHACLEDDRVPKKKPDCDYCSYRETVGLSLKEKLQGTPSPEGKKKQPPKEAMPTLF